ncbi:unnamed protein product [Phytophthora fragariaefolia]|uniref:Unnamed protein product n=1 Tax=Phytophthora fragariaefolia TaxID=1490495 RepID=A0A9W7D2K9_9STRA|nr:unnamed protein product [Phytophthora fragariaefolia]
MVCHRGNCIRAGTSWLDHLLTGLSLNAVLKCGQLAICHTCARFSALSRLVSIRQVRGQTRLQLQNPFHLVISLQNLLQTRGADAHTGKATSRAQKWLRGIAPAEGDAPEARAGGDASRASESQETSIEATSSGTKRRAHSASNDDDGGGHNDEKRVGADGDEVMGSSTGDGEAKGNSEQLNAGVKQSGSLNAVSGTLNAGDEASATHPLLRLGGVTGGSCRALNMQVSLRPSSSLCLALASLTRVFSVQPAGRYHLLSPRTRRFKWSEFRHPLMLSAMERTFTMDMVGWRCFKLLRLSPIKITKTLNQHLDQMCDQPCWKCDKVLLQAQTSQPCWKCDKVLLQAQTSQPC